MAHGNTYSIAGNLTADPELRFTQSGVAVVSFTVANTARSYNKDSGEWEDGDTIFMRCNAWRDVAENIAESLVKGSRVLVSGWLKQREYDKDGVTHRVIELEVEEVGASLRNATVVITRIQKNQPQQASRPQGRAQSTSRPSGRTQNTQQRGRQRPQAGGSGYAYDDDSEPPF